MNSASYNVQLLLCSTDLCGDVIRTEQGLVDTTLGRSREPLTFSNKSFPCTRITDVKQPRSPDLFSDHISTLSDFS